MNIKETVAVFLLLGSATIAPAAVAKSLNYSFEFAVIGSAGASSSSATYSAVTQVKTSGVTVGQSASPTYTMEPTAKLSEPKAAVVDWAMY